MMRRVCAAVAWDLVVVGAGAVGSAALRAAGESGARVLGLEQHVPANRHGSSHGHSRIFRHAYFEHPDYVPLLRHSTARFESLERESGAPLLHRCGMLVAGPSGSEAVRGSLASALRWGLAVESLDARLMRERLPWFAFPSDAEGALERDAGLVRPEAAIEACVRAARRRGAELRVTTRASGLAEDPGGVTITTAEGEERAAAVIVAAGAWTATLLPELAPLLSVTRQVQAWMAPSAGVDAGAMPCWYWDRGRDRRALYGLAPDPLAGDGHGAGWSPGRYPKFGLHGSSVVVDPDRGAVPVGAADIARVQEACRLVAPALAGSLVAAATCLYTMSPDAHFLVGTRRGGRRVHFAAGLSGHGFKLAPALGDALVDLALRGRTHLPVGFLSPERFRAVQ
jgi:sarcosine oxidase